MPVPQALYYLVPQGLVVPDFIYSMFKCLVPLGFVVPDRDNQAGSTTMSMNAHSHIKGENIAK